MSNEQTATITPETKAVEKKAQTIVVNPLINRNTILIEKMFVSMMSGFRSLLPRHITAERYLRSVMGAIQQNIDLQKPNRTLLLAVMKGAALGIEPDGIHGALIPYGDVIQFQTMYRGLLDLVRRSAELQDFWVEEVREKDHFKVIKGLNRDIEHDEHRLPLSKRGEITHVYSVAVLENGQRSFHVMDREEIIAIRDQYSESYWRSINRIDEYMAAKKVTREKAIEDLTEAKKLSAWITNEPAMMKKTVIIQHSKFLPMSIDKVQAMERQVIHEESTKPTPLPLPENVVIPADVEEALKDEPQVIDAEFENGNAKEETTDQSKTEALKEKLAEKNRAAKEK